MRIRTTVRRLPAKAEALDSYEYRHKIVILMVVNGGKMRTKREQRRRN